MTIQSGVQHQPGPRCRSYGTQSMYGCDEVERGPVSHDFVIFDARPRDRGGFPIFAARLRPRPVRSGPRPAGWPGRALGWRSCAFPRPFPARSLNFLFVSHRPGPGDWRGTPTVPAPRHRQLARRSCRIAIGMLMCASTPWPSTRAARRDRERSSDVQPTGGTLEAALKNVPNILSHSEKRLEKLHEA